MKIDPTARIDASAKLGKNVTVGAFACIESNVEIGDDCMIESQAFIRSHVRMGHGNHVHPYVVIGGDPQDISFDPAMKTGVMIGDDNVFREHVTIHRATQDGGDTRIGSNGYFMNYSHAAHDCVLGDHVILANAVQLGGHVQAGDRVFFGAGAMAHQFSRVGSFAMVAALIGVRKDVLPYSLVGGEPVRHYRMNTVGLRRAGIPKAGIKSINDAFRQLRSGVAVEDLMMENTAEVAYLKDWLSAKSKRGVYGWTRVG